MGGSFIFFAVRFSRRRCLVLPEKFVIQSVVLINYFTLSKKALCAGIVQKNINSTFVFPLLRFFLLVLQFIFIWEKRGGRGRAQKISPPPPFWWLIKVPKRKLPPSISQKRKKKEMVSPLDKKVLKRVKRSQETAEICGRRQIPFSFSFFSCGFLGKEGGGTIFDFFLPSCDPRGDLQGKIFFNLMTCIIIIFPSPFFFCFWWNEWLLFLFFLFTWMEHFLICQRRKKKDANFVKKTTTSATWENCRARLPPPSFLGKWLISQTETLSWKIPLLSLFFLSPPLPLKSFAWINEIFAPPPPLFPPLFNCPCVCFQAEVTWLC